jgi:hypothetical protein
MHNKEEVLLSKYCQISYNSTNHHCKIKKLNECKVMKLDAREIINKYRVVEICAY